MTATEEKTEEQTKEKKKVLYDVSAPQTYKFDVTEAGEKFETAHIYKALSEERYAEYFNSINAEGDDENQKSNVREAQIALWKDLIDEVSNIDVEEGADFRDLIDVENEIIPSIENFLAVAVVVPEKTVNAVRKLGKKDEQTIITEAYFNGKPCQQTHTLRSKTDEWSKKFDRIVKNQWSVENTKGLRRKPKVTFVPQNKAFGELYDEMHNSSSGFVSITPVRFKVEVLNYIFASSKLDPKP